MTAPRYILRDHRSRLYLRKAVQLDGNPAHLITAWTRDPARAWRFPGVKSARRMAERLGIDYSIINQRGETLK